MAYLFWGVVGVLSLLGLTEVVRWCVFWLMKPAKPAALWWVISPKNGEECEQLIRAAVGRIQWMDWRGPCYVECLNETESPQVEAICKVLERRYPMVRLCKKEDLVYDRGSKT